MKIVSPCIQKVAFCAERKKTADENPVSVLGERQNLLKVTAIAGLGAGVKALWWLYDEGFLGGFFWRKGVNIVDKNNKNVTGGKKQLMYFGAWGALALGFIGAVAALYTLYKTPEIMYKGKVNAFVKGKDMDVYIKSNNVEKELYNQMNDKAKNASADEKKVLSQQYLKLKAAKNQVPDFVSSKNS